MIAANQQINPAGMCTRELHAWIHALSSIERPDSETEQYLNWLIAEQKTREAE